MPIFPYSVAYSNVRTGRNRAAEVEQLACGVDVLFLGETHWARELDEALEGFVLVAPPRQAGGAGVLAAVRSSVPHRPVQLPQCSGLEAVAVSVCANGLWIVLVGVYGQGILKREDWEAWLSAVGAPMIVCGDFNAHHPLWSVSRPNQRGRTLAASLQRFRLQILNDGEPTFGRWVAGAYQTSVLDLVLCSGELADELVMVVSDDVRGSDHHPILVRGRRWGLPLPCRPLCVPRRPATGSLYKSCMRRLGLQPKRRGQWNGCKDSQPVWWTPLCRKAVCDRRRAYRRFKRSPTEFNWWCYCGISAESSYILRQEKSCFAARVCQAIKRGMSLGDVWRLLRPSRLSGPAWIFDPVNPTSILVGEAMANAFNARFGEVYDFPAGGVPVRYAPQVEPAACLDSVFTDQELSRALSRCREGAMGVDRVPYSAIRALRPAQSADLLTLLNEYWCSASAPSEWKTATLVPVLRKGSGRAQVSSYRPIALLSCVYKLVERMVAARLQWWLESTGALHSHQFGFRRYRSAQDAVLFFETGVREAWADGGVVLAAFLDIKAAYDLVSLPHLWAALQDVGVGGRMLQNLQCFFQDRSYVTRVGGFYSQSASTSRGLPQGSCLSPLLFTVVVDRLLRQVSLKGNILAFADDLVVWVAGADVAYLQAQLAELLAEVDGFLRQVGLQLSPQKCHLMLFSLRPNQPTVSVPLAGAVLTSERTVRYLGVLLDSDMSWSSETKCVCDVVAVQSRKLGNLMCGDIGGRRCVLRAVVQACVLGYLDFHLPFLGTRVASVQRVQVAFNCVLRVMTGCLRSTPIPALHVEAGFPPLVHRVRSLWLKLAARNLARGKEDPLGGLLRDYGQLRVSVQRLLGTAGHMMYWWGQSPLTAFCLAIVSPTVAPWEWLSPLQEVVADSVSCIGGKEPLSVFCDGAYRRTSWDGGVGVVIPDLKLFFRRRVPMATSSTYVELLALAVALDVLLDLSLDSHAVVNVCSDSRAALTIVRSSIQQLDLTHPVVLDIVSKLQRLHAQGFRVRLCWLRGHVGHSGNVMADGCAKLGCAEANAVSAPVVARDCATVVAASLREWWQADWDEAAESDLFPLQPVVGVIGAMESLPRGAAVKLARLRTGHTRLPDCDRFVTGASPWCRCGTGWGGVSHFLLVCPLYDRARARLFSVVPATHLADLLSSSVPLKVLRAVATFVQATLVNV